MQNIALLKKPLYIALTLLGALPFDALGGAYAALESSETVFDQDAVFENNQIDINTGDALGGGLYAAENSKTVFSANATFKNNFVKTALFGRADGGGLYAANSASVTFNGSTRFEENSAEAGGAIAAFGKLEFNKTNAEGAYDNIFLNNRATGQGGAIYGGSLLESEGKLEAFVIKGGTLFDGNTVLKESYDSQLMGGAVGLLGLELDVQFGSKTVFQNNAIERTVAAQADASIWGGALASFTKSTTFNGYAEFTGNKITAVLEEKVFGGAAFGTVGDWTFKGSATFDSNAISVGGMQQNGLVGGGALALAGGTHKFEKGNDPKNENTVLFKNNEISMDLAKNSGSSLAGGALDAETGANVTFEGKTDFIGNKITIKGYDGNAGEFADAYGGAIYAGNGSLSGSGSGSGSKIVFNDAVSFNNNGISTVVSGNLFGGAVSVSESSAIEFNGTAAFYNNSVSASYAGLIALGGAMTSDGAATNFKKGATFVGNKISVNMGMAAYGGALVASQGATFGRGTAQDENYETRFINNAIEVETVVEESNKLYGGALAAGGNLVFEGVSTFEGNKISLRDAEDGVDEIYAFGGAIYNTINTAATTTTFGGKATFANNTVEVGGKADADGKATAAGGAMFITSEVGITVGGASLSFAQGAEFINNHVSGGMASIGGALASSGLKDVLFGTKDAGGDVRFDNNYASANNTTMAMGGAFYEDSRGEMNFYGNAFFTNNRIDVNNVLSADGGIAGGALAALTDTVNFERDVTFGNNYIKVGGSVAENTKIAGGAMAYFGESELTFANGATFTNNRIEAANGVGKGGALYVVGADVHTPPRITFNGETLFQGNYVTDSTGTRSNSIYADGSNAGVDIHITTSSGKSFTDYDGMDGTKYAVRITGGGAMNLYGGVRGSDVTFEKTGGGVLTLQVNSSLAQGLDRAALDVSDLKISAGGLAFTTAGTLTLDTNYLMMRASGTFELSDEILALNGTTFKTDTGYTFEYVIDKDGGTLSLSLKDYEPPAPTRPVEEETNFVNSAKSLVVADVRAGVAQITDRLSSLGAGMSVSPASPTANQGRSGGDDAADISLWAKALYTSTDLRGATKMDSDGYGFIIGIDGGAAQDLYLGAALGYTHNKGDTDLSHFKSETYLGYLYGRYALTRKTGLTGTIGYGFTQFDLDAATDKFNAHTINAQATADYALPAHLTAEIGARYTFSAMDAYTTGTTKVAAQDTHTGTVLAGLRYRRNVGGFVVKANAGALYDVYSDAADYRLTQSGVASYARGERLHRFGGEAGAGIGCEGEAFGVEADYNAQVRKDYNDQTVSVKLVYRFNAPKAKRKRVTGGKVTAVPAMSTPNKVAEPIVISAQNKVAPASPTPAAPQGHLQVSSFKKEKNARKQYRNLSKKYPELRGKTPEYKQVDVKGKGRRVRTYVAGEDGELKTLCQKMHGDLKNTCLIGK